MTRIVCVGITVLDRIWYLDDLPKEGGKYVAQNYTEVGGGNGGGGCSEARGKRGLYWPGG